MKYYQSDFFPRMNSVCDHPIIKNENNNNGFRVQRKYSMEERRQSLKKQFLKDEKAKFEVFNVSFNVEMQNLKFLVDNERVEIIRRRWKTQDWYETDQNRKSELLHRQETAEWIMKIANEMERFV